MFYLPRWFRMFSREAVLQVTEKDIDWKVSGFETGQSDCVLVLKFRRGPMIVATGVLQRIVGSCNCQGGDHGSSGCDAGNGSDTGGVCSIAMERVNGAKAAGSGGSVELDATDGVRRLVC